MSGKLGVSGAYNRPRTLTPIVVAPEEMSTTESTSSSGSAKYSKLERECKRLKMENTKLTTELDDMRVTLKQLISESSHEKFDERRINLLKLQMIQLERQIALLNESLGSRQAAILEVENAMAWLADKFRSYIAAEVKGPMVSIARSDLTSIVELSESSRIKLFKAMENSGKDTVGKDLLFLNPFLGGKHKQGESLSLLDISLQRMDYINLRHVAQLETKLCLLYKELIRVCELFHDVKQKSLSDGHMCSVERERIETVLLKSSVMIKDAADDLLALSLLCPSSPWPVLKRPLTKQIPVERVTAALPALPRGKQEEVTHIIESSIHVCNHRQALLEKEKAVLKEELAFHRSIYDLQLQYTQALFEAVRKGYGEFEDSARQVICEPLKIMLDAYKKLTCSASESAFREFLIIMKENENQLTSVVDMFSSLKFETDDNGSVVFSKFGEEFMEKINSLMTDCQKKRDTAMKQKREIKEEQVRRDLELQHLIEDLEAKYDKIWTPKTNHSAVSADSQLSGDNRDSQASTNRKDIDILDKSSAGESIDKISSRSKRQKDDPTVLRSFLDDDYDGDEDNSKVGLDRGSDGSHPKSKTALRKDWVNDTSIPAEEHSETVATTKSKTDTSRRWKPDKEWVSDFSGLSDRKEATKMSRDDSHISVNDNTCDTGTKFVTNRDEKPTMTVKKTQNKTQKSALSYEPKLFVANRTLKLRRSGSLCNLESSETQNSHSATGREKRATGRVVQQRSSSHGDQQIHNHKSGARTGGSQK